MPATASNHPIFHATRYTSSNLGVSLQHPNAGKRALRRLAAIACALSLPLLSAQALAEDKVTFQLDWLPGGDKAPIYVGLERGLFADAGLDVSISQGRGSTDAITKLATGSSDIGLSDITALMVAKSESDVPVSAVYSVFSQAPHAFYITDQSGIERVSDLSGRSIATSPFTSSNLFLPLVLQQNGVSEADVTVIKTDPGALNPMLMTGRTDAVISWVTDHQKYAVQAKEAGRTLTVLPWYEAGIESYATSLIASDRFLAERPDVARRFIDVYAEAIKLTWQDPDGAAQAVNARVPEVDVDSAAATIRSIENLVFNTVSDADGLGAFTPERLSMTWNWTAQAQGIDAASYDPELTLNRTFAPGQ